MKNITAIIGDPMISPRFCQQLQIVQHYEHGDADGSTSEVARYDFDGEGHLPDAFVAAIHVLTFIEENQDRFDRQLYKIRRAVKDHFGDVYEVESALENFTPRDMQYGDGDMSPAFCGYDVVFFDEAGVARTVELTVSP
jgi:hypothetical protein